MRPPRRLNNVRGMSASSPTPDISLQSSELTLRANTGSGAFLFTDLVRASEKRRWEFETERPRGLEIDGEQEV